MSAHKIINPESLHDDEWNSYNSNFHGVEILPRIKIATNWIKHLQPKILLDIGCGPGHLAKIIKHATMNIEIHGIDFSQVGIKNAETILDRCWYCNLDTENIPAKNDSYDAVICLEVLEHVYDINHVLQEIRRVLKPSGRALISVPNLAYWRYRLQLLAGQVPHGEVLNEQHIHVFNLSTLKQRIAGSGMRVERYWGYGERLQKLAYHFPNFFSSTLFMETYRIR